MENGRCSLVFSELIRLPGWVLPGEGVGDGPSPTPGLQARTLEPGILALLWASPFVNLLPCHKRLCCPGPCSLCGGSSELGTGGGHLNRCRRAGSPDTWVLVLSFHRLWAGSVQVFSPPRVFLPHTIFSTAIPFSVTSVYRGENWGSEGCQVAPLVTTLVWAWVGVVG